MNGATRVVVDFVDGADVRMVERGRRARLAQERAGRGFIRQPIGGKELQRDLPRQLDVFGAVDNAHAAGAKLGEHAIVRNRLTDHGGTEEA